MGVEKMPPKPIMSTLNPNASVFVPAVLRVAVNEEKTSVADEPAPVVHQSALEPYSLEWWHAMETDAVFREQYMCSSAQELKYLADELDMAADQDQFHSYQEELVQHEEEEELARNLAQMDFYLDEDLSLTSTNNPKNGVISPRQPQVTWSKNSFQHQSKTMPYMAGGYPKKSNTYHRIQQPRADM